MSMLKEIVLVVEDETFLRQGLYDTLQQEGFTVFTAVHGRDALAQMEQVHPDLILSDISMPEMDGITLLRTVRARPEWTAIPFVFLTARGERHDVTAGRDMGAEDYLVKPVLPEELVTAIRSRLARARQLQLIQLRQAYEASLTMLANAIEVRDHYTRGHVERVTAYAEVLARYMGLDGTQQEQVRWGAILHDIGKIHVRESVLRKSGPLTDEEWAEIRRHPLTGEEMIKGIHYLALAAPTIRHHHERWDGRGYPDALHGETIPLVARIVAVADTFDAMTTDRSYRPAHSLVTAYQTITQEAGMSYDPAVVAAFRQAWEEGELQSLAQPGGAA
ncbi:MAG: response regulator [Chloroflexi bacterium]|nr:response regulator [Chloroflexota bacterium]MCI0575826.1 response regulator [Chloroflexota bacterium]MCI0646553.1 response regulator [Chloroflexota bacterium]MCI0726355.1 response regulator [Chloroflexota bacterium]